MIDVATNQARAKTTDEKRCHEYGEIIRKALWVGALATAVALAGCSTPTSPRYSVSAANNQALRALQLPKVAVGSFAEPKAFYPLCRGMGGLTVPDGMTHTQYIRKALVDELQLAGVYDEIKPLVRITGVVSTVEFSSTDRLTGGHWLVEMSLQSSTGARMDVRSNYSFDSAFAGDIACINVANAWPYAVQDLVGKIAADPSFAELVKERP
jgi:hypothetical protein